MGGWRKDEDCGGERKSRFEQSREAQEEFVNGIARTMVELGGKRAWERGWHSESLGVPYCALTGRPYSGGNMVRLFLLSLAREYRDDRWVTFRQMKEMDEKAFVRKGEHGVKLLRPDEIFFYVDERGERRWIDKKKVQEKKDEGFEVDRYVVFLPFTAFNASQIENFPGRGVREPPMGEIGRDELVEAFIASSGVPVEHGHGNPCYHMERDLIMMPMPGMFADTGEYYSAKLHEFFHATGHRDREDRFGERESAADRAREEMRAELFSVMAAALLGLPATLANSAEYVGHWNKKFSGGDAKAVFKTAFEAGRILDALRDFRDGNAPRLDWYPDREEWPGLCSAQKARDGAMGVVVRDGKFSPGKTKKPDRSQARHAWGSLLG